VKKYDLCVIGGGPAGFAAASRAWDLGRSVVLVEKGRIGGAGLHNGALSSKTMWELANDYATACRTDRGYRVDGHVLSYAEVVGAVRGAVWERRDALEQHLDHMAGPSELGGGVTRRTGTARLVGPHRVEVVGPDGAVEELEADHVLICTGSSPRSLPDPVADGRRVVTSDHIEELADFPRRLVVLGAGVVGCEYATVFSRFGKTEVHLVDREDRILPFEDEDVSAVVSASLREAGLRIHHRRRLVATTLRENGVDCVLESPDGDRVTVEDATLLLSIGRVPNTRGLGLEALGVELLPSGAIKVEDGRSSVDWIWAAGDTTLDIALVNVAELEGRHVVERLFGDTPRAVPYDALSTILFVQPEVAAVGLNEQQARQKGIAYRAGVVSNVAVPRAVAMRSTKGFVKLLASPDGHILGLRVVGPQASSTIQGCALLIASGGTLHDIDACIHPHPAIPEGVQEAARLLLGRSMLKPSLAGSPLQVRSWSPTATSPTLT
jgi:dihydrolipoamide dehydrogenase